MKIREILSISGVSKALLVVALVVYGLNLASVVFLPAISLWWWLVAWLVLVPVILLDRHDKLGDLSDNKHLTRVDFAALFSLLVGAIILRLIGTGDLWLGVDAFENFVMARHFANFSLPSTYAKGWLYSLFLALSQWVFGGNNFALIIPGLVANVLTMVAMFFFITKFFNKYIGFIATLLLAISPWQIAQAQTVRMYNFFQLFFLLLIVWLCYAFTKKTFYFKDNWKFWLLGAGLFLLALESHPMALGIIPIVIIFIIARIISYWWRGNGRKLLSRVVIVRAIIVLAILVVMGVVFSYYLRFIEIPFHLLMYEVNYEYWYWFLSLYGGGIVVLLPLVVTILALWLSRLSVSQRRVLLFINLVFYGFLVQFVYFYTGISFSLRFVFHLNPLFVLLLSVGIYLLVACYITTSKRLLFLTSLLVIVLLIVLRVGLNYRSEVRQVKAGYENMNILYPYEIRYPFRQVVQGLNINPADYLLSTHKGLWEQFSNVSKNIFAFWDLRGIHQKNKNKWLLDILRESGHGYYLTDVYRQKRWGCDHASEYSYCFANRLVDEAMVLHEDLSHGPVLLYEWSTLHPDKGGVNKGWRKSYVSERVSFDYGDGRLKIKPLVVSYPLLLLVISSNQKYFLEISDDMKNESLWYDLDVDTQDFNPEQWRWYIVDELL